MVIKDFKKLNPTSHSLVKDDKVQDIAGLLHNLLADIHALYLQTLGCHWNMSSNSGFYFFHELLEKQYKELADEQDLVATALRRMGKKAPSTMQEYRKLISQKESFVPLNGEEMIEGLAAIYEQLIPGLLKDREQATLWQEFETADMLLEILHAFEKRAWILRSHLRAT